MSPRQLHKLTEYLRDSAQDARRQKVDRRSDFKWEKTMYLSLGELDYLVKVLDSTKNEE